ncbi:MAG TPA: GNAT family N-acetyltransferase [Thermoanaerobaculia bacterium]|nr:GNAT family N-acetyltransferase [Thermoanaerobaculia bacterium]
MELAPWSLEDLPALHALWIDPDVRRFLWDGEVISRERAAEVVRAGIDSFERHGFGFWAIREKRRKGLIGFCGFRFMEPGAEVEILYGIDPRLWGRGYATEAARGLLEWAFRETGLRQVLAGADAPNRASFRVLKKLGMRYQGTRPTPAGEANYWIIDREAFSTGDQIPRPSASE